MDAKLFIESLDDMGIIAIILIALFLVGGCLWLMHFILTLPMRRAERARLFVDLIESSFCQGRPLEETIISRAQSRDMTMGAKFHLAAARLEEGASLQDSLAKARGFLPLQVEAMLRVGWQIGDLKRAVPAARQLLIDGLSHTRAALNYLLVLTFVITPFGIWIANVLDVWVLPKFRELSEGVGMGELNYGLATIYDNWGVLISLQVLTLLSVWLATFAYIAGPELTALFPFLDGLRYRLPWRRKRLQRDFSTMLAILLDSGVPEPDAVRLAGDCTANNPFRRRARLVVEKLKSGISLTQAVAAMDDTGEFGWRLTNAVHGKSGFLRSLGGWHESLDAKAFQQEQAAAHVVSTGLVLWTGVFVGIIVVSVFAFLVSIVNEGVLW
jgi:type II secretory pathway component PulF